MKIVSLLGCAGMLLLDCSFNLLSQAPRADFSAELAAARRKVVNTPDFRISKVVLGKIVPGQNTFTAIVKNKTKSPLTIALDLATSVPEIERDWLRTLDLRSSARSVFELNR